MSGYVFPKALKELRIHFSNSDAGAEAVKSFLASSYAALKLKNPHTPILIREAASVKPAVYARFEFGREKKASLEGVSDVGAIIKSLVKRGA